MQWVWSQFGYPSVHTIGGSGRIVVEEMCQWGTVLCDSTHVKLYLWLFIHQTSLHPASAAQQISFEKYSILGNHLEVSNLQSPLTDFYKVPFLTFVCWCCLPFQGQTTYVNPQGTDRLTLTAFCSFKGVLLVTWHSFKLLEMHKKINLDTIQTPKSSSMAESQKMKVERWITPKTNNWHVKKWILTAISIT